ncbi:MAG: hypothetical protein IKF52_06635 [Clostridia bacterium]|nr:hypothetical protein [Clostridia bacterium]
MKKIFRDETAITLVALVITIIVLLILAGVTLSMVVGENGIITRALQAKDATEEAERKEREDLTNLDREIDAILGGRSHGSSGDNGSSGLEDNVDDTGKIIAYRIKDNNETLSDSKKTALTDLSGHGNNANLYNVGMTNDKSEIVFDGSSSYGEVNLSSNLSFPLSVEIDVKANTSGNGIIYFDPVSKIALGTYGGQFLCSGVNSGGYNIPSDFYDGNLKHIVLTYSSATNFSLFVNGSQISKASNDGYWSDGGTQIFTIGKRANGYNWNGKISKFRIYGRLLDSSELTSVSNSSNLILDYDLSRDQNDIYYKVNQLNDLTGNNNNTNYCDRLYYNSDNSGIVFDGVNSSAQVNIQNALPSQFSVEFFIRSSTPHNGILFIDRTSQTAFGTYNNLLICSTTLSSKCPAIPADFFDGNLKHVVINYRTATDFDVYVNGTKLTGNSDGYWNDNSTAYLTLGTRVNGPYFNGTLYEFNIYNSLIDESKINSNYNRGKNIYK